MISRRVPVHQTAGRRPPSVPRNGAIGGLDSVLESDDYTIPLGLGLGKVFPTEKIVYNAYVEPQYSVVDRGDSFPQWQIFAGFNLQF